MGGPAPSRERARSSGAVASGCTALRPGYPDDVVAFAVGGREGHASPLRVLDLAAGTGLLTAAIAAAGHDVVAAAQAAHWFEPPAASREFRRVLRAGGAVGFVRITRDDRAPWAVELAALLAEGARDRTGDRPGGDRAVVEAFAAELDAEVASRTTAWAHRVPPEAVVGRAASSSRVALLADEERAAYLERVRRLGDTHPDTRGRAELDLDHSTTAWRLVPR